MRLLAVLAAGAVLAAPLSSARADEVDDLIEIVESRPADMNSTEWKEARREAARKLGRSGDRRAVPVLIDVVETEKFDVIAEIAIEALAELGDERAIEPLQKVHADRSRDRYVRNMARQALRKLGAEPAATDPAEDAAADAAPTPTGAPAGDGEPPPGPMFDDQVLAATDRLTFALGSLRLQYDSLDARPISVDGDVQGRFERTLDRTDYAHRYGADAAVAAGIIDYEGDDSGSRALLMNATGFGDARIYRGDWFGMARGAAVVAINSTKVDRPGPDNDTKETMINFDLHAGLSVGWGRVLEMGEAVRLRRIELVLEEARMLGRPITPDLAERIFRAWWALRGEQGYHEHLVATVRILREAGVLLGEPDASTTYKLLQVLADGQLSNRPHGLEVHGGIAESYLRRDEILPVEEGRIETLLLAARYGRQQPDGLREIVGEGFARYRILSDEDEATPWSVGASAALRRYVYGDYFDPIGALEIGGVVGASSDGIGDDDEIATRVRGVVAWRWSPNRASHFRLAGTAGLESGALFIGATFEAVYGLLDVGYVGAPGLGRLQ